MLDVVVFRATVARGRRMRGCSRATEPLDELVARIAPRPILLIYAGRSGNGEDLNVDYHRAASEPKQLWKIPEARHVGGLQARPREYERRVTGFFDHALLGE